MNWAARRRFLIVATIVVVLVAIFALVFYSTLHRTPSCVDTIQNEGEAGIDCGGPCAYLCTEQESAPVVRFTQALSPEPGKTSVIAYVDNPNRDAYARAVPYTVEVYASDHTLAAPIVSGTLDLPPGTSVPVFVPGIASGAVPVATAFLTIDSSAIKWQAGADTRNVPRVSSATIGGTTAAPRITAELDNLSAIAMGNTKAIVAVFDAAGNVMGASQTIVAGIPAQGSATATFTWNAPFPSPIARVEVLPVVSPAGS